MADEIVLDLGEYGEILVELAATPGEPEGQLIETGIGDTLHEARETIKVKVQEVLSLPLTGLAAALMATIPVPRDNDYFEFEQFSVQFDLGLTLEGGVDAGVTAKIIPNGGLTCTYSWKRK